MLDCGQAIGPLEIAFRKEHDIWKFTNQAGEIIQLVLAIRGGDFGARGESVIRCYRDDAPEPSVQTSLDGFFHYQQTPRLRKLSGRQILESKLKHRWNEAYRITVENLAHSHNPLEVGGYVRFLRHIDAPPNYPRGRHLRACEQVKLAPARGENFIWAQNEGSGAIHSLALAFDARDDASVFEVLKGPANIAIGGSQLIEAPELAMLLGLDGSNAFDDAYLSFFREFDPPIVFDRGFRGSFLTPTQVDMEAVRATAFYYTD